MTTEHIPLVGVHKAHSFRIASVRIPLVTVMTVLWILFGNHASASGSSGDRHNGLTPAQQPAATQTETGTQGDEEITRQREAAEEGDAKAQFNLGWLYAAGDGVPKDYPQAVLWWQKAAEQGLPDAQLILATVYQNGMGVAKDDVQAVQWYRRAAEQGNARAQNYLGEAYHGGDGVMQDYAEALQWYRKAAEQGDAQAQSNLGFMYQNGEGVSPDAGQAVQWWLRAAELGNASAQYNLAVAYHNAAGVIEDYAEALKWVVIAAAHASDDKKEKYAVLRDALTGKMTPARIVEGQKRAREWFETFEKRKP